MHLTPILLYTDGAARRNPGPGGYGIVLKYKQHIKELSHGFRLTTNNRMELLAVIMGLKAIQKQGIPVWVYSDSKYVCDAINQGWLEGWIKTGFKNKKNTDLWRELYPLLKKYEVKFIWIKGHAGHPENERCDALATQAADNKPMAIDQAYERELEAQKGLL